jgi:hypothetical protein
MNLSVKKIDPEKYCSSKKQILMNRKGRYQEDSQVPFFEIDQQPDKLATIPARRLESNAVSIGAKKHLFNTLDDLIAFGNGACNAARDAVTILHETVQERVDEKLSAPPPFLSAPPLRLSAPLRVSLSAPRQ